MDDQNKSVETETSEEYEIDNLEGHKFEGMRDEQSAFKSPSIQPFGAVIL